LFSPQPVLAQDSDVRVILPFDAPSIGNAPLFPESSAKIKPRSPAKVFTPIDICTLIAQAADTHQLPRPYFARLIWKESRFDISAVSPKGAMGVAQFMPGTALKRGLSDPFDPEQAIPASAAYLAELRTLFGNLGLAAAAYNSGERRVEGWLKGRRRLPAETEDYVLSILGKPAYGFVGVTTDEPHPPLAEDLPFEQSCAALPRAGARFKQVMQSPRPAWGAQIGGHVDQAIAQRQWRRFARRFPGLVENREPAIFRQKVAIGRRGVFAVQIGAATRREASDICRRVQIGGGSCIVKKN
jgi:hypothetical protein